MAARIKVWDLPTRVFHWSLVAAVSVAALTGFVLGDAWLFPHVAAGYVIGALLVFRLAWGLFGPEFSRFASFDLSWRSARAHLRDLVLLRPARHVGHNPLGAAMIVALLALLLGTVLTGIVTLGGEEKQGPLAGIVPYRLGHAVKELHEGLANLLLACAGIHVAGVTLESLLTRVNLVRAMVKGDKAVDVVPPMRPARPLAALAFLIALGGVLALAWQAAARVVPTRPVSLASEPAYARECGACHDAFHPSLLPAASWGLVMAGLPAHFGEDARLPEPLASRLHDWLAANAAESVDTEAANRFRRISAAEPLRITASPYWVRKHRRIADAAFADPAVRSRANCAACHADASSGRFDDDAIAGATSR